MTPKDQFLAEVDVSRETVEMLDEFAATLEKWNRTINLVSQSTLPHLWTRHFLDSATAFGHIAKVSGNWLDLGSGAGFPALVLAILAKGAGLRTTTLCIESDTRKSTFLRTIARLLDLSVKVETARIEEARPTSADAVTARALAPLPLLLSHCHRHLTQDGLAFLHKGGDWQREIQDAQKKWCFQFVPIPSLSAPDAVVLKIGELRIA